MIVLKPYQLMLSGLNTHEHWLDLSEPGHPASQTKLVQLPKR